MKTLLLIKHSSPEIDPTVPACHWHLSDIGRARCKRLASLLLPYQPKVIFSSIETKAAQTAEIVSNHLGVPWSVQGGLHEHDRTNVGLLPAATFERSVHEFFRNPQDLVFGRETAEQALQRFQDALGTILRSDTEDSTAVVAHGTVISLYVADRTGCDAFDLWCRLGLPSFLVLSVPEFRLQQVVPDIVGGD